MPRGGEVWLGSVLRLFEGFDVGPGVIRTSMSRLGTDGWVASRRVGRNSYYHLTDEGRASFEAAAGHVYRAGPPQWDGRVRLAISAEGADRDALRAWFGPRGWGSPLPGVWVSTRPGDVPPGVVVLESTGDALELARRSWPLERLSAAYEQLLTVLGPLDGPSFDPYDATLARLLLVHEYRRVALRDPGLPGPLLPAEWPGERVRELCARVYPRLLPASEAWLDEHGQSERGPLPPADDSLRRRFRDGSADLTEGSHSIG